MGIWEASPEWDIQTFSDAIANINTPPGVENPIPDQVAIENKSFSFTFAETTFIEIDPDDSLTYSATLADGSSLPTWLSFDPTTRTFSGTPTKDNLGVLNIKVTATDKAGATVSDIFTITNEELPVITLAVSPANVVEDAATNLVYTFTRTGPTTNALTVTYDITGTADATDYTGETPGTTTTITFAANSATATLTIDLTTDTTIEPDETVILTLTLGTGYTIGTPNPVTATITNDDKATQDISQIVTKFRKSTTTENQGSLVYDSVNVTGNIKTQADDTALNQTNALFHNLVGLYQVENANGAILDTLDLNGNGATNDLLNPNDAGYARTAITNTVNNFILQMGANSDPAKNTNAAEFGDVLLQGGKLYAPFAIANGGNLIPKGGTLQDGINNFLAQNPNNTAANLTNFMTHAVAYFSFGNANPNGTEHLQNRGNNVFGFEDLPGNLGISDFDFNDAVFKFTFIG